MMKNTKKRILRLLVIAIILVSLVGNTAMVALADEVIIINVSGTSTIYSVEPIKMDPVNIILQ